MQYGTSEYRVLHTWIQRNYGKADRCDFDPDHTSKKFEWANLTGEYVKDIDHYRPLCTSCHKTMDKNILTACKRGHPRTPENIRRRKDGDIECRVCNSLKTKEWIQRQLA